MMESFEILCGIAVVILALYYYFTSTFDFWKSRGVRGPRPTLIFGTIKDVILMRKSMATYVTKMYNDYKNEPMIGIFAGKSPILIVKNPELIKNVLIKDFSTFADRGTVVKNHEKDSLSLNLAALKPKKWRPLRTRLSPVFTSGKLKEMFSMISECANRLDKYIEILMNKNEYIECRELTAKYTTDVIGTCAFGIETNALADENSEFRRIGRKMFASSWINVLRMIIREYTPWIYYILGFVMPQREEAKFFTRFIKETMEYREINNIVRNDFVDVLRELKKHPDKMPDLELTDSLIAAQAVIFFAAGFETSSMTMSNALYELAINQKMQNRLREEIDQEYAKHGSDLKYEDVKKMDYLDKIFKETLRKYPPVAFLRRKSMSNYTFDDTNISIPKDQTIWIPIYATHQDPDIYPKPDIFDPERFSEEVAQTRHAMFYLPFGDGPRNCIGARFAIFQTKIGLIKILRNYKVETCEKTQIPYVIDPKSRVLAPKGGINLRLVRMNRD